jgi:hypothetical protein
MNIGVINVYVGGHKIEKRIPIILLLSNRNTFVIEMMIVEMVLMSHCIVTRSVVVTRWCATMGSVFLLHGNVMEWITVETIRMRKTVVSTELFENFQS